jgi:hypothetical protein
LDNAYALLLTQSLGVYNQITYDDGSNYNQGFTSIKVANCTIPGTSGFVLGGWNDGSSGVTGDAVIARSDNQIGLYWSTTIQGFNDANCGKVVDVFERLNLSSNYEYYGACVSTAGSTIYKVDDSGFPFGTTYVGNPDEFLYYAGSVPEDISFYPNTATTDVGLHIFGNKASTAGDYYAAESYFSGESGCSSVANIGNYDGTVLLPGTNPVLTPDFDLVSCTFGMNYSNTSAFQSYCGPNNSLPVPASNNRATGVGVNVKSHEYLIGPNPFSEATVLSISSRLSEDLNLKVFNILGQEITCDISQYDENGIQKIKISFPQNISEGLYEIRFIVAGSQKSIKVEHLK